MRNKGTGQPKVKWNSKFLGNPFWNCGPPPEVVFFFCSEQKGGNFLTIWPYFPVSSLSSAENNNGEFGNVHDNRHFVGLVCWFWKNPHHYSTTSHQNLLSRVIPTFILTNGEQNGAWCVPFADVQLRSQAPLCFDKGGLNLQGKGSFFNYKRQKNWSWSGRNLLLHWIGICFYILHVPCHADSIT